MANVPVDATPETSQRAARAGDPEPLDRCTGKCVPRAHSSEVELYAVGGRAAADGAVRHPRRALLAEAHVAARVEHDRLLLV